MRHLTIHFEDTPRRVSYLRWFTRLPSKEELDAPSNHLGLGTVKILRSQSLCTPRHRQQVQSRKARVLAICDAAVN